MTDDPRSYRAEPDAAFVDRLERKLLRRLGDSSDSNNAQTPIGDDIVTLDLLTERPHQPRHRRSRFVAVTAVAAAVAVGALIFTRVRDDGSPNVTSTSVHEVAFDLAWPDLPGLESPDCIESAVTYAWAQNGHCFRRFTGTVALTGDVSGTALWMMLGNFGLAATAQDSAVKIPAAFTGTYLVKATVEGCGTGEFMISEQLRFDGWESGAFSGTWQVVPGSGRGELSKISGGGQVPGDFPSRNTTQATRKGQLGCS